MSTIGEVKTKKAKRLTEEEVVGSSGADGMKKRKPAEKTVLL
jgi:hypothetical protein